MSSADLAELLERAEADLAAQGRAYRTESDEDGLWRASWNTWRTLGELLPAVRDLIDQPAEDVPARLALVPPLRPSTRAA
ncbi:hypothetical protein [Streptacidiphilus carbonis]|uniref:hypothetical protein n=1 Tax=Streptacidiphilus carbonis TaxID=105422 RepID=UPI0005AAD7AA|nr:hypothetical protein [Streptacidiphilus carbonis]